MEDHNTNKRDICKFSINKRYNNNSIEDEVKQYIYTLNKNNNKNIKNGKIKITNENSNHFLINSEQLPKGLVLTTL